MEEKIQVLGNLSLTFEGHNSMDAEALMESLSGAIRAYKATLSAKYDEHDTEISMNIKGFAPGSVEVLLESVIGYAPTILPYVPSVIEGTKNFLEIIKLKKELRGKKPVSVESDGNKAKITNHKGETSYYNSTVYNLYINNPVIDAGLSSMFSSLSKSDRPAISFNASDNQVKVEETDYQKMCTPVVDEIREEKYQKMESTVEEQLLLKSADFLGDSKWSFYFDGRIIHVSIEDEQFMEAVKNGKIMLYAGVRIPAQMKIEAYLDEKVKIVKTNYTILKVLGNPTDSSKENTQLAMDGFDEE